MAVFAISGPFGSYYHYLVLFLELVDSKIKSFSVCCRFKSLHGNFVWGLIGVYGPNDDNVRSVFFEELVTSMSNWDIPWSLGGDFNVTFLFERSTGGRLTFAMAEFCDFIDSCGLIDSLLEGVRFTWSSHEEVLGLSRIDRFLFTSEWEDHFQGMHQGILPKITLDHLFQFFSRAKRFLQLSVPSNLKIYGLRWKVLVIL